jgi:hypothetical protein
MYVGSQLPFTEENLRFAAQMGITHVDTAPDKGLGLEEGGAWRADKLCAVREKVESFGLTLAAMHLPLSSAGIEKQVWPNIMLGAPDATATSKRCASPSRRRPRRHSIAAVQPSALAGSAFAAPHARTRRRHL